MRYVVMLQFTYYSPLISPLKMSLNKSALVKPVLFTVPLKNGRG